MTIPGIMVSTNPTFYLVPVTKELSDAVMTAQFPQPTWVLKCVTVAGHQRRVSDGMADTESFLSSTLSRSRASQRATGSDFWLRCFLVFTDSTRRLLLRLLHSFTYIKQVRKPPSRSPYDFVPTSSSTSCIGKHLLSLGHPIFNVHKYMNMITT